MKVKKILVPVDYSDYSRGAVEHAVWLADQFGAEVHLLHVGMRPVEYLPLDEWIWGEERDQHHIDKRVREAAKQAFDKFVKTLPKEIQGKVEGRVELGVSYNVIIEVAQKDGYDLIVLGTHGRTGTKRFMLGSVTERVVRRSTCPVLVVPKG